MTEQEWQTSGHAAPMLNHLHLVGHPWDVRELFLIANCLRFGEYIQSEASRSCLKELERRPSVALSHLKLRDMHYETAAASRRWAEVAVTLRDQAFHFAEYAVNHLVRGLDLDTLTHCSRLAALRKLMLEEGEAADCHWVIEPDPEEEAIQAHLLRCIVGNPFRPVAFEPAWRTEHAVGLASKMYDERDFRAMPILADALEEAGCDRADVLSHCREPGPHARGCWVVDGVLGKR